MIKLIVINDITKIKKVKENVSQKIIYLIFENRL